MTARTAVREMKTMTELFFQTPLPRRPDWYSAPDRKVIEAWRKYLKWEEGNPLQLEDQNALHTRVMFSYRKAIVDLRFYPEIWCVAD